MSMHLLAIQLSHQATNQQHATTTDKPHSSRGIIQDGVCLMQLRDDDSSKSGKSERNLNGKSSESWRCFDNPAKSASVEVFYSMIQIAQKN